ncbi:hypothetical protein CF15_03995 [Pyrodictium occultum]|uniref:Uncharacterized protein n=1 Tax=Pyrodictium occultum TaxID=2309 RepID=A0A0V8RVG7_PYROC|nr:hypothetical protein CF15_03995 [Pyrodictium occultum]
MQDVFTDPEIDGLHHHTIISRLGVRAGIEPYRSGKRPTPMDDPVLAKEYDLRGSPGAAPQEPDPAPLQRPGSREYPIRVQKL